MNSDGGVSGVAPGWYKDPADPTTQRYWDGEGWLGEPLPADAPTPEGPPEVPASPPPTPLPGGAAPDGPFPGGFFPGGALPGSPAGGSPAGAPDQPPPMPPPPPVPGLSQPYPPPSGYGTPGYGPPGYAYPMPAPRPHGLPLAPLGVRLVARLIDIGIVLVLNVVVNGWFVLAYLREALPVSQRMAETGDWFGANNQISSRGRLLEVVIFLVATALWFAYEVPSMANTGQTIGKRLVGIRVVGMEGTAPLGFARAVRRWSPLGLPTLLWWCCVGFVWQFFDCLSAAIDQPLHQAIHDKSARTVVVYAPKLPEEPHDPVDPS
ncbi:RDD family protein [Rhizomonospora bruguierae]|uniref:RDD family protein n=1 Tax=Rhizomonospora bruguierae TaxID=1581705 RepID=UPI001BCC5F62|nr:RDD family protein [Micromonospora sp. NBRC 107566]